jgi:hypothetical protein
MVTVNYADDRRLQDVLEQQGYHLATRRFGVRMVKPLGPGRFEAAFGDRFYFSPTDAF